MSALTKAKYKALKGKWKKFLFQELFWHRFCGLCLVTFPKFHNLNITTTDLILVLFG